MKRHLAIVLALPLAGCGHVPLGYLQGDGVIAAAIARLAWGLIAISSAVCVIVAGLLLYAVFRRRQPTAEPVRAPDDRGPIRWIAAGVAISTVFLVGSAVWTLVTVHAVGQPANAAAFTIDVVAQEWWWAARYQSSDPSRTFTTANELILPVGTPVRINLTSKDVIHSFWVPKLGGKMDMIPSRTNVTWLQGDVIGDYRGQCSEFCGLQHANMAFDVQVVSKADFEAWWNHQLAPATTPPDDPGLQTFMVRCASCHAIRGTQAGGILGPDLTHFGTRKSLAAGLMANSQPNLEDWINNTQTIKPGAKMPELHMLAGETHDVAAYLEGLN